MKENNAISGLLTQKPDSPIPQVGDKRRFSTIPKTGKNGKPFIKIKSEGEGYGGIYEILSVQKTDFTDNYGNVSYSLRVVPANERAASAGMPAARGGRTPEQQTRIERQHAQHMALLFLAHHNAGTSVQYAKSPEQLLRKWADYFHQDTGNVPPKQPAEAGDEEIPF